MKTELRGINRVEMPCPIRCKYSGELVETILLVAYIGQNKWEAKRLYGDARFIVDASQISYPTMFPVTDADRVSWENAGYPALEMQRELAQVCDY